MISSLNQNYKKIIIIFTLFVVFFLSYFFLKLEITPFFKFSFLFIFFLIFLSLLSIFEMTNSFVENVIFWLVLSLLASYFYLLSGPILFFLAFLKIISQKNLLQSSLKPPFFQFVVKNYTFVILVTLLIFDLYFYQILMSQKIFPLSFQNYQIVLTRFNNLLSFFNLNIPWQENFQEIIKNFFKKYNLPSEFLMFLPSNLEKTTLSEFLYQNLETKWQKEKWRQNVLLSLLFTLTLIFYPLAKIFSSLIAGLSLIFYYFYLKIGLVKISSRSVNKETLEL